jgi:nucleoside-diphosphate-sugar epimerase
MRILVTGATGFTGSYVVPLLLQQQAQICCLVRESSDTSVLPAERIEFVYGDLNNPVVVEQALQEIDVLVHIASLGSGHAREIVNAAVGARVQRAIFVSTTAIFTSLDAPSKSVRLAAEANIRRSGLAYTILRPTMIYGSIRDRNMCRLIRYLKRWPVIPIFGSGEYLQQPVYVEDVAAAVLQAISTDGTIGQAYNIPGATALTYNQVIDTIGKLLGGPVWKIHVPMAPIVTGLRAVERLAFPLPIKAEQIQRMNEDKAFSWEESKRDFGYQPHSFAEGIRLELGQMGLM